jgi:hypothetical protein
MIGRMVPEASLERTENGLMPRGEGWFVLNAREARWAHGGNVSASCERFPKRTLGPYRDGWLPG